MSAENFFAFIFSGGCEHAMPEVLGSRLVERLNVILGNCSDERAFQACRFFKQVAQHFQYFDIPKVPFDNGSHVITSKSREYSESVILEGDRQLLKDSLSFALTCYSASVAAAPEEDLGKAYSRRARALFIAQRFEDCSVDVDNALVYRDLLSGTEINYLISMKRFCHNRMGYNDPYQLLDEFYVLDHFQHAELTTRQKIAWLVGALELLVHRVPTLKSEDLALPAHLAHPDSCRMPAKGRPLPARSSTLPADMCRIPTHMTALPLAGEPYTFTEWQWLVLDLKRQVRRESAPVLAATNRHNRCFTDAVEVTTDRKGREVVVACRDILAGELIAVERPWASIVNPEEHCTFCDHCKLRSFTLIPCSRCSVAMFCNEACSKAGWIDHHRDECAVLRELLTTARNWHGVETAALALRMFFTAWRESNRSIDFMRFRFSSVDAWPIGLADEQATLCSTKIHFDPIKTTVPTGTESLTAVLTAASLTHLLRKHSEVFSEPEGGANGCGSPSPHHPVRPYLIETDHGKRYEFWSTILDNDPTTFLEEAYADKIKVDAIVVDHLGAGELNDDMMRSIVTSIAAYEQAEGRKEGRSEVVSKNIENAKRKLSMQIANPVNALHNNSVATENDIAAGVSNVMHDKLCLPSIKGLMNFGEAEKESLAQIREKNGYPFDVLENNSATVPAAGFSSMVHGKVRLPSIKELMNFKKAEEEPASQICDKNGYPIKALNNDSVAINGATCRPSPILKSVDGAKKKPALHNCDKNSVDALKDKLVATEKCVSNMVKGKARLPSSLLKNDGDTKKKTSLQMCPASSLKTNSTGTKKDPIKDAIGIVGVLMKNVEDAEKRLAKKFSNLTQGEGLKSNSLEAMVSELNRESVCASSTIKDMAALTASLMKNISESEKKIDEHYCKDPAAKPAGTTTCPVAADVPGMLHDVNSLTAMLLKNIHATEKRMESTLNHDDALKNKSDRKTNGPGASNEASTSAGALRYIEEESKRIEMQISDMNNIDTVDSKSVGTTNGPAASVYSDGEVCPPEIYDDARLRRKYIEDVTKELEMNIGGMDAGDTFKNILFARKSSQLVRKQVEDSPACKMCKMSVPTDDLAAGDGPLVNKNWKEAIADTPSKETKGKGGKRGKRNKGKGELSKEILNINGMEIEANFEMYDDDDDLKSIEDEVYAESGAIEKDGETDTKFIRLNEGASSDAPSISLDEMREFVKRAADIMKGEPAGEAKVVPTAGAEGSTITTFCGHLSEMMRNFKSKPPAESDTESTQEGTASVVAETVSDVSEDESSASEPIDAAERRRHVELKLAENIKTYNALKNLTDGTTADEILGRVWRRYRHVLSADDPGDADAAPPEAGHAGCRGKLFHLTAEPIATNALPLDKDSLVSGIVNFAPRPVKLKPMPKKGSKPPGDPFTFSLQFYDENIQPPSTLVDLCVLPSVFVDRKNFAVAPPGCGRQPPPDLSAMSFARQAETAQRAHMFRRKETLAYSASQIGKFQAGRTFFRPALWDDLIPVTAALGLFYTRNDGPVAAIDDFKGRYYRNCFKRLGPRKHFPPVDTNFSYVSESGRAYVACVKTDFFHRLLPTESVLNDAQGPGEAMPWRAGRQRKLTHADVFYDPTSSFRDAMLPWYYDFFEVVYSRRLRAVCYLLQRAQGEEAVYIKALLFKEMMEFRRRLMVRRPLFGRPFTIAQSLTPPPLSTKLELRLSFVASMMLSYFHLARNATRLMECTFSVDEADGPDSRPPRPACHRGDSCMNPDLPLNAESIDYSMVGLDSYRPFGVAIYSTPTYLPHSCDPNVFPLTACGDVGVWATMRHVNKGETLTVSYGPHCALQRRYDRRAALRERYGFECECSACAQQMKPEQTAIPVPGLICLYCRRQLIVDNVKHRSTSICPKCKKRNKTHETEHKLRNVQYRIERMRNALYGRPSRTYDFLPQLGVDSRLMWQHVRRPCQLTFAVEEVVKMALMQRIGNFYCIE